MKQRELVELHDLLYRFNEYLLHELMKEGSHSDIAKHIIMVKEVKSLVLNHASEGDR